MFSIFCVHSCIVNKKSFHYGHRQVSVFLKKLLVIYLKFLCFIYAHWCAGMPFSTLVVPSLFYRTLFEEPDICMPLLSYIDVCALPFLKKKIYIYIYEVDFPHSSLHIQMLVMCSRLYIGKYDVLIVNKA